MHVSNRPLPLPQVVDSEERAQVISKARTSNAEFHRRAALARLVAADQERVAAAAGDEGGEAGGEVQQRTLPLIIKADVQVGPSAHSSRTLNRFNHRSLVHAF